MEKKGPWSSCQRRQQVDFSLFIDRFITSKEGGADKRIQINTISDETGIEKRRLYDLMNVLCAFGVCNKTDIHRYVWTSMNQINISLLEIAKSVEKNATKAQTFNNLFVLPESPSVGCLATTIASIFIFFGSHVMNIHDISLFLSNKQSEKQLLRRLYLVTYMLEKIKILRHGSRIGEYEITCDVRKLSKMAFEELANKGEFPPDSIEFQLNRFTDDFLDRMHNNRFYEFNVLIQVSRKRKGDYQPSPNFKEALLFAEI
ncbi:hypothetical protein TRFO_20366 [Tritrichomonas foetus]|uniref:E2F/DP family winged-helix DNA-binding domain-containing protein n=1 Tax=Tritrichomonas foetus TaxID=1144522 RepID=A0A1J4KG65_9EUKA|nr:hypothetical protein TRFO_20366 [Tritrichomonas foetus]|eukprot:OHT10401.1 hypothetical protein TRFO_20366 [Tritrichomonas foetus]